LTFSSHVFNEALNQLIRFCSVDWSGDLERLCKEAVVADFNVVYKHLVEESEGNYKSLS